MAVSPQSAALRSAPGYAPRQSSVAAFTPAYPQMAALPNVPQIDDARAPNWVSRQLLANQLGQIGNQQNATFTGIRAGAKQALAGYGGWKFSEDDPTTPQREDLLLNFDAKAGMGEREKGAFRGARDQANAAGMLESSFANQNIAQAVQRMSLEAQQIATQYASQINAASGDYSRQTYDIVSQWTSLYGADAAYLAENPPPAPPPPAPAAPPTPAQRGVLGPWQSKPTAAPPPGYRLVKTGPANPTYKGAWIMVPEGFGT